MRLDKFCAVKHVLLELRLIQAALQYFAIVVVTRIASNGIESIRSQGKETLCGKSASYILYIRIEATIFMLIQPSQSPRFHVSGRRPLHDAL